MGNAGERVDHRPDIDREIQVLQPGNGWTTAVDLVLERHAREWGRFAVAGQDGDDVLDADVAGDGEVNAVEDVALKPRLVGKAAHLHCIRNDAEEQSDFGVGALHFGQPHHALEVFFADMVEVFGYVNVGQALARFLQMFEIRFIEKLAGLEPEIGAFVPGGHEPEQLAHLFDTRDIRDEARDNHCVVSETGPLAEREAHASGAATNAQPGKDGLGDEIEAGALKGDFLALLLEVSAEQAEPGEGGLLDQLRFAKVQHVPLAQVRFIWILDAQFDHVLALDGIGSGFELITLAAEPKTADLARRVRRELLQHKDLYGLAGGILYDTGLDLALTIDARHSR